MSRRPQLVECVDRLGMAWGPPHGPVLSWAGKLRPASRLSKG